MGYRKDSSKYTAKKLFRRTLSESGGKGYRVVLRPLIRSFIDNAVGSFLGRT